MRAKLGIIITIIIITGVVSWLDYSHSNPFLTQETNVETLAKPAPNVGFVQIDRDADHHLSNFRGKAVLINFWASWCEPCLHEFPLLVDLAAEHPDSLALILLSSDMNAEQAYKFSRDFGVERGMAKPTDKQLFPKRPNIYVAWDKDRQITREIFGTTRYPESILISSDGTITHKFIGVLTEDNIDQIRQQLSSADAP